MVEYTIMREGEVVFSTGNAVGSVIEKIMAEHLVRLSFAHPSYLDFRLGDTVTVYGKVYTLRTLPPVRKNGNHDFEYPLEFAAPFYELADVQYFTLNTDNSVTNADFFLNHTAEGFVDLLIQNANRVKSGWVKGTVQATEMRNLSFSGDNCLEVLSRLAAEFETEWHIDGRTIHLYRRGEDLTAEPTYDSGLTFEYGKARGLRGIERTNVDPKVTTRLYAFGSERNILGTYRDFSPRLLMPEATGRYLSQNEDLYGVREETRIFEEVYPQRIGQITSVSTLYKFTDAFIDFNLNTQLIPGVTVKVNFLTGQLAGYTFELLDPSGFNDATKEFTLLKNADEKALDLPNELLRPAVGDLYVLSDLIMPASYVTAAEALLQEVAQFYLEQNSSPKLSYRIACDVFHFRRNLINLRLAQSVRIKDADFGIDRHIRIVSLERNINDPFDYKLDVADSVKLLSGVLARQRQREIDRLKNRKDPPAPARTGWRAKESSGYCLQAAGANTGFYAYATLEQYYLDTQALTGAVKQNDPTAADYVPPGQNPAACPVGVVVPPPPASNTLRLSGELLGDNTYRVQATRNGTEEEILVYWEYQYADEFGTFSAWQKGDPILVLDGDLSGYAEGSVFRATGPINSLQVRFKLPLPAGYTEI